MSDLSLFVCETRTGRVVERDIPLSGIPRTGKRINTEGPLSFSVPMSRWFEKESVKNFIHPWRYSYGVEIGNEILQCGPLVIHPEYDPDGETWQFDCAGMWRLFNDKRVLVFTRDYPNASRHDIVRKLLADDMAQINGDLPLDLPDLDNRVGPGGRFEWAKFSYVGSLLKDQTDDGTDGVEIEMKPYYPDTTNKDTVRWKVGIGSPNLGDTVNVKNWYQNNSLVSATPVGDGSRIADLYIVPGQTSGDTFLFGAKNAYPSSDALQLQGYPLLMDLDTGHTSAKSQSELDGYALGNYGAFHRPAIRIVKARVRTNPLQGSGPRLGEWTLGDLGTFGVVGYIGLPDAEYQCRIIGADLATPEDLDLELQLLSEVPS